MRWNHVCFIGRMAEPFELVRPHGSQFSLCIPGEPRQENHADECRDLLVIVEVRNTSRAEEAYDYMRVGQTFLVTGRLLQPTEENRIHILQESIRYLAGESP